MSRCPIAFFASLVLAGVLAGGLAASVWWRDRSPAPPEAVVAELPMARATVPGQAAQALLMVAQTDLAQGTMDPGDHGPWGP